MLFSFFSLVTSFALAGDWNFSLGVQRLTRPETSTEDYFESRNFQGVTMSLAYKTWWYELENNLATVSTGNITLSTERKISQTAFWIKKDSLLAWEWLRILIGGGVGVYHESVTTNFGGSHSELRSADFFTGGASLGLRLNVPYLWLSLESRAELMQNWNPSPNLSYGGKIGFWF
jgi:hypothetical protein